MADPSTGRIIQLVGDTLTPRDPAVTVEEVGHIAFGRETPKVQERLLAGVRRAVDEFEVDPRSELTEKQRRQIAELGGSVESAKLTEPGIQEERLTKITTRNLIAEGFNPAEAQGFAQQFVRTLKDLYYRAALKVQEWLGHDPSPALALRYFENRIRSLLAGDRMGQSYLDFIGAAKPTPGMQQRDWFGNSRATAERMGADGRVEYDYAPGVSGMAMRFNSDARLRYNCTA